MECTVTYHFLDNPTNQSRAHQPRVLLTLSSPQNHLSVVAVVRRCQFRKDSLKRRLHRIRPNYQRISHSLGSQIRHRKSSRSGRRAVGAKGRSNRENRRKESLWCRQRRWKEEEVRTEDEEANATSTEGGRVKGVVLSLDGRKEEDLRVKNWN